MTTVVPDRKFFTTGQVAKICQVAPRTVSKWFDSGRLRGYRIPGSQDRRIPREHLIRFLEENGMPLGALEEARGDDCILIVSPDPELSRQISEAIGDFFCYRLILAGDLFAAGVLFTDRRPGLVLLDFALGRSAALHMAAAMLVAAPAVVLVALPNEDDPQASLPGFARCWPKPFDPDSLAQSLERYVHAD